MNGTDPHWPGDDDVYVAAVARAREQLAAALYCRDNPGQPWPPTSGDLPYLTEAEQLIRDCPALVPAWPVRRALVPAVAARCPNCGPTGVRS